MNFAAQWARDRSSLRSLLPVAAAGLLYLAYAAWLTWPMPTELRTSLYGGTGDVIGAISDYRELAQHAIPFLPGRIESLGVPDGTQVNYVFNIATWPSAGSYWLGTLIFGAVPAMNLFVLAGFVLTGLSVFLFVRWRTGDAWIAALAGWALAFLPDPLFNAGTAPDMMHRWVLVLLLWRLFKLREEPSRRNGLLAGAAAVVTVSWNPYYLLMGTVFFGALVAPILLSGCGQLRDRVRGIAWAIVPPVAAGAVYVVVAATAAHSGVRDRSFQDLYVYSLHPLEFLLPPSDTLLAWLEIPHPRDANTYVYVGLTLFVLAVGAVALAAAGRMNRSVRTDVMTLAWLAFVGIVWSGPPTFKLWGLTVYLPSYLVGQITTTWRVYGRFGAFVELAVVLLAAYGLWLLVRNRHAAVRAAMIAAVAVLVVLDLRTPGLETVAAPAVPPIYYTLREQPPGAVAEYPIVSRLNGAYDQLYRQDLHHRPLLNGFNPGTPAEARALSLGTLDDQTVEQLARLKISYIVFNRAYPVTPGDPIPGVPSRKLRLIAEDGPWTLYRVPGAKPLAFAK